MIKPSELQFDRVVKPGPEAGLAGKHSRGQTRKHSLTAWSNPKTQFDRVVKPGSATRALGRPAASHGACPAPVPPTGPQQDEAALVLKGPERKPPPNTLLNWMGPQQGGGGPPSQGAGAPAPAGPARMEQGPAG